MSTGARTSDHTNATAPAYYVGLALLGLAFAGLCAQLATHEYFKFDDWHFLNVIQKDDWSWGHAFLPIDTYRYWAIRPLGEQTYFRLCFDAFGLDATGYLVVSLIVHAAVGPVVYRIARAFGVSRPVAVATGMLAATRNPSMAMVWSACGFAYMLSQLCVAASVMWFVEASKRPSLPRLAASSAALAAALLSHESSIVLPPVLLAFSLAVDRDGAWSERLLRGARRITPHSLLVIAYLAVRFGLLAPLDAGRSTYVFTAWPLLIARRYWLQLGALVGGTDVLVGVLVAMGAVVWWVGRTEPGRRQIVREWLPLAGACTLWIVAVLGPMVALAPKATRFSVHIEVPACLMAGSLLELAWRRARTRRPWEAPLLTFVLVAICLPWEPLRARLSDQSLVFPRQMRELLQQEADRVPAGGDLVFLYGAPELADWTAVRRFRSVSYGYVPMVSALLPGRRLRAQVHDVRSWPDADVLCSECLYLALSTDLTASFVDDEQLSRWITEPAFASGTPEIAYLGGAKLFDARGREAAQELQRVCARRSAETMMRMACREGFAKKIALRGTREAHWVAKRLRGPRPPRRPRPGAL